MIEVKGKYAEAKVFIDIVEEKAMELIKRLVDEPFVKDNKIRIMPDVHYGNAVNIGTTIKITDKIVPNIVGGDICCGVLTAKIANKKGITEEELEKLDEIINNYIPAGMEVRNEDWLYSDKYNRNYGKAKTYDDYEKYFSKWNFRKLKCYKYITNCNDDAKYRRFADAIGTLGGGEMIATVLANY